LRSSVRYEHPAPGDLVHVDIKKLGRIPDGGGHRVHGRAKGNRVKKSAKPGTAYIHHALDDHSRLVYSEILAGPGGAARSESWLDLPLWSCPQIAHSRAMRDSHLP